MLEMAHREILPAVTGYVSVLVDIVYKKQEIGIDASYEKELAAELSGLCASLNRCVKELESILTNLPRADMTAQALYYKNSVIPAMESLRRDVDRMEMLCPADRWPYPTYGDLLFGVH